MAAAERTNNTEQLQRFINNLWQHQQEDELCDFTLTTSDTFIECHRIVLCSASSYFSELLCDSERNINIIDVTPLPEYVLRTVVAFMYNSEYVIDDENVIELLKLSETWNLDILVKLCEAYMDDNVTINNACRFYNFAIDNDDHHKSQILNEFIREHFTRLYESGQLRELSLKNFTTIIEHDEINVRYEDVIFSSAVQIINKETSVEDINRCLELIRFPRTSRPFLVKVLLDHPLMRELHRYASLNEAFLYQKDKISIPNVKPPRSWQRKIYYIGKDHCMHQYLFKVGFKECRVLMNLPEWVDHGSSVALQRERVVIVGGMNDWNGDKRAMSLDLTNNTKEAQLPDLPELRKCTNVVLSDHGDVYVVGGYNCSGCVSSVYSLSPGSDTWQTKKSMPQRIRLFLMIQHQQYIYVLGGRIKQTRQLTVFQYSIMDDIWKQCNDMPVACDNEVAGVVVHEEKIKVITLDKCLIYSDDTDTWTVKQYSNLGDAVKAFVRSGRIWAAVQRRGVLNVMSYDDVDNVWSVEHWRLDNVLNIKLIC